MSVNAVIVDAHTSVREMVSLILESREICEVVGQAGTGPEALDVCREVRPQLVILDLSLPERTGVDLLKMLRREDRSTRILVFTGTSNQDLIMSALHESPHGFVHKQDSLTILCDAVRAVLEGNSFFSQKVTQVIDKAQGQPGLHQLSQRERSVLRMIAEGQSGKQISAALGVSPRTIEYHRTHLMEKLNARDSAKLIRIALDYGLVAAE